MLTNLDESLEFFKREKGKGGEVRGKNEESMKQGARVMYLINVARSIASNGARERIDKCRNDTGQTEEKDGVKGIEGKGIYVNWERQGSRVRKLWEISSSGSGGESRGKRIMGEYAGGRIWAVKNAMNGICKDGDMKEVRTVVAGMRKIERLERNLWEVYFGDAGQGVLDDMIMGILTVGRSWFRVCFISMSSITSIVSTVGLMREEGTIEGEGGTEKCKAEVCRGASGDGVERLVGIARKEIKRDVEGYKWKKEELRIPAEGAVEAEGGAEDPYKTWYNPVKTTLLLLSRIFSVLPMPVFDDLCRTAVSKCLENLHLASGELSELEDKVQGWCFFIKNVLTLREQLAPFEADMRSTERGLTFSGTGPAVRRFVANRSNLFSLTGNAVLSLGMDVIPKVTESEVDKKEELDEVLRRVCNQLVEHVGNEVLGVEAKGEKDLGEVRGKIEEYLPKVVDDMGKRLNGETVGILKSSIKRKIVKALMDEEGIEELIDLVRGL
ncbi:hypothetical protein TrCOL_g9310 [Triparma columacea]|uniref:Conserved oligomeric Golgi complex subunit 3 C-terminal domain-containing protein n=1 Tax=Triparma columacea TaxID=722753 RepID=A0A9W7LBY8_9STRA|nr:hypothetical protein TrCOL_g9310 [Triparma columacea]